MRASRAALVNSSAVPRIPNNCYGMNYLTSSNGARNSGKADQYYYDPCRFRSLNAVESKIASSHCIYIRIIYYTAFPRLKFQIRNGRRISPPHFIRLYLIALQFNALLKALLGVKLLRIFNRDMNTVIISAVHHNHASLVAFATEKQSKVLRCIETYSRPRAGCVEIINCRHGTPRDDLSLHVWLATRDGGASGPRH